MWRRFANSECSEVLDPMKSSGLYSTIPKVTEVTYFSFFGFFGILEEISHRLTARAAEEKEDGRTEM